MQTAAETAAGNPRPSSSTPGLEAATGAASGSPESIAHGPACLASSASPRSGTLAPLAWPPPDAAAALSTVRHSILSAR
jgi:hypothetical protein